MTCISLRTVLLLLSAVKAMPNATNILLRQKASRLREKMRSRAVNGVGTHSSIRGELLMCVCAGGCLREWLGSAVIGTANVRMGARNPAILRSCLHVEWEEKYWQICPDDWTGALNWQWDLDESWFNLSCCHGISGRTSARTVSRWFLLVAVGINSSKCRPTGDLFRRLQRRYWAQIRWFHNFRWRLL